LSFDPGSLDPDLFYGNEGLLITTSCYDGLLRYKNNTTEIVPDLAESFEVSEDSKTYTFKLRSGLKFADGTPLTSEAVKYSVERRRSVDGGPAYMVAPIESVETPDETTVVMQLKTPIEPFTSWLASPYGLKIVNQKLIEANAEGDEDGKKWLAGHCAGSGPYDLAGTGNGQRYELKANPNNWEGKPDFDRVVLSMIPSFSTQALQLEKGQLDLMTHGLTKADVQRFEKNPGFTVSKLPAISAINLWVNPNKRNLKDSEVRKAIAMALDREKLVSEVYGDEAEVYNDLFAPGTLPPEYGFKTEFDAAAAKAIVDRVPADRRKISLQFTSDDATNQQIAGIMAQQLNAVGFEVDQRGLPETEVFNFTEAPDSQRPDMIVLPQNPDDASPSSFPQLQWLNTGAFFPPFDPETDKIFQRAVTSTSSEEALPIYGEAAQGYAKLNVFVPIANTKAIIVTRKGIANVGVERQGLWTVDLGALKTESTASGT
jgi:peptide/nickel transport system substrate-binding protein